QQISDVGQQVKEDDKSGPDRQTARQNFLSVFYFLACKRDVIPRIASEKWTNHRQSHCQNQTRTGERFSFVIHGIPELCKIHLKTVELVESQESQHYQTGHGTYFRNGKRSLDFFAGFNTAAIHPCQK